MGEASGQQASQEPWPGDGRTRVLPAVGVRVEPRLRHPRPHQPEPSESQC